MTSPYPKPHGKSTSVLEKSFASIVLPFQELIHHQKTASILLLLSTMIALIIANSPLADAYHALIETRVGFVLGDNDHAMSLQYWINDGLMALFFFILGLEIKRELLVGELRDTARALPVFVAAIGGMLVPALLFYATNHAGSTAHGWAIPMATDTAFAIGVLTLLGNRIPTGLTTFLLALAIIDDMGAVLVIAFFYSDALNLQHLSVAAVLLVTLMAMNLLGIRRPIVYFAGGGLVWLAMLGSGLHATLAGVLVAMIVPARPKRGTRAFVRRSRELIDELEAMDDKVKDTTHVLAEPYKHEVLEDLQETAAQATTPLQLWERALKHPVALFVLPLFALTNAGISLELSALPALLGNSLGLGILLGLVLGKVIGISLPTYALLKLKIGRLPDNVQQGHIIGLGMLGGMGFTMSIFIATLGFADHPEQQVIAKISILTASLIAGACGYLWLRLAVPAHTGTSTGY